MYVNSPGSTSVRFQAALAVARVCLSPRIQHGPTRPAPPTTNLDSSQQPSLLIAKSFLLLSSIPEESTNFSTALEYTLENNLISSLTYLAVTAQPNRRPRIMGSVVIPHLASGWHVDQAILSEEERLVVIRFVREPSLLLLLS